MKRFSNFLILVFYNGSTMKRFSNFLILAFYNGSTMKRFSNFLILAFYNRSKVKRVIHPSYFFASQNEEIFHLSHLSAS